MPGTDRRRMAEREGFEPSLRFYVNTLSRRAPSTARPPLQLHQESKLIFIVMSKYFIKKHNTKIDLLCYNVHK